MTEGPDRLRSEKTTGCYSYATVVPTFVLASDVSFRDMIPTLVLTVAVTVLVLVVLTLLRWWRLPPDSRSSLGVGRTIADQYRTFRDPTVRAEVMLASLIAVGAIVAAGSGMYAITVPSDEPGFTEFSLLTGNRTGALVANDYPTEFETGEEKSLVVRTTNKEHEPRRYTVVARLQRQVDRNGTSRFVTVQRLTQFSFEADPNESATYHHTIEPEVTGERLRLQYALYRGAPPANETGTAPYRELHYWITVTEE